MPSDNRRNNVLRQLSPLGESEEAASELDSEARHATSRQNKENNKFEILCDGVINSLSETQASIQDLLQFKDSLLLHYLPPPLLFRLAIIVGKVYRSFSDMNTPVNELVRLVRIYSLPWDQNSVALKRLHDMFENKKHMLNLAIKRLTLIDKKTKLFEADKRIQNWEKLYIKLSEAKGHGRRWKFQIETFRKKANIGYDELIRWIKAETEEKPEITYNKTAETKSDKLIEKKASARSDDNEESDLDDRLEDSEAGIESDDESFLSKSSRKAKSAKKEEPSKPVAAKVEISTQTTPEIECKETWTGEPEYIRFFIVRLFKPPGLQLAKLRCKIKFGDTEFLSRYLEPPKAEKKVKIVEAPKKKGRLLGNKATQKDAKKEETVEADTEDSNSKKEEEIKAFQDFVFKIDDRFKRRSILETSMENVVIFEMVYGDPETLFGYTIVRMDDVQSLELPILYYKAPADIQVVEFNSSKSQTESLNSDMSEISDAFDWLKYGELTDESKNIYEMLAQRQPMTFPINKEKIIKKSNNEIIGNLPLHLFWTRKPIVTRFDKNTGSESLRDIVQELTGFDIEKINRIEIEQLLNKNMRDSYCSPMPMPPPPRPPSTPVGVLKLTVEEIEGIQTKHSKELQGIHENYQLQIDQLNLTVLELEDELTQLRSIHELKNEGKETKGMSSAPTTKSKQKLNRQKIEAANKAAAAAAAQQDPKKFKRDPALTRQLSLYGKDLPEDFLERLKVFNEKSSTHHKEIIKKYILEEAKVREQQMSVQHRLDPNKGATDQSLTDFCLPAVFMPYKATNNIFNPKAHQYFHPSGYTDMRLTQPPTVFALPPLPSKSVPIINLFELGKRYQAGEPDYYINKFVNSKMNDANNTEDTSEYSVQKPNSLASKNNTALRLDIIVDQPSESGDDNQENSYKNEDLQESIKISTNV